MAPATEGMRLVSLCPSLTETLFEIGAGASVIGATKFCVEPRSMPGVVRIGGTKDPSVERILELEPTLVFANREENRLEDVMALEAAGVTVHASMPRRVAEVPALIRDVGEAAACEGRAERVAAEVERALDEARASACEAEPRRFAVLVWRRPWIAASSDTFLSNLLEEAGGVNVLDAAAGRYPEVTMGEVARLDPNLILLPSEPFPFARKHVDELAAATRGNPLRFLLCDGQLLTWHGSRTAQGLRAARRWLAR